MASDEKLLKEIRDNFTYSVDYWRDIRKEGSTDMRYIAGDPWEPAERKAREDAKRPCIALDELNQYVNQLINDVRMNKRAIKVIPKGNGATDQTAELRANMIRAIEYKSNAQAAYCTAFEGAAQRSYGFARISKRYVDEESDEQELVIKRIPNPDTVYIDPDCREADCADMGFAFIVDQIPRSKFLKQWPNARITDFSAELLTAHPHWLKENSIQIAEYWRRETTKRKRYTLKTGDKVWADEADDSFDSASVATERQVESSRICQYITNGVEILEENEWDGKYIPIGVCFGKELYIDQGSGSKRILMSLIRLGRDPYMLYCYYRTCEMELAGMVPKTPVIMYEGQPEGHEQDWQNIGRVPLGYLEVKPITDATGAVVLPLPQFQRWEPPIQAYEIGAEAAKRAIQAAVGMYNTSVGKHDTNAQSGVAIKALDQQSSQGSFHFIDNYDLFLEHMGRMLDDLLGHTYDTPRDAGLRKPNEEHEVARINEPYLDPKTKAMVHHRMDLGDHDVTISTGPSSDSQRDAAQQFLDSLAGNEQIFPRIADLVVKLRDLGPIGDEIAKRLIPPDIAQQQQGGAVPPQAQHLIQQYGQMIDALKGELTTLTEEIKSKKVELDSRERIAAMQEETKRMLGIAQLQSVEGLKLLEAGVAELRQKTDAMFDMLGQSAQQQHERDMQATDQAHQAGLQSMAQGHQSDLQVGTQAHQMSMAENAPDPNADRA